MPSTMGGARPWRGSASHTVCISIAVVAALAALAPLAIADNEPPSTHVEPEPPSKSRPPHRPALIAANDDLTPIDFPPPDFHFGDYNSPPPIESDNPPYIPPPPVASPPPPGTRVPPRPPSPPRSPSPPPRPPSPPPQPPYPTYGPLPMRLVGGTDNSSGVVEIWNEKEQDWGALCFPAKLFSETYYTQDFMYNQDSDVAKLICRQLGQPYLGAWLLHPDAFPSVATARLRGWALSTNPGYSCGNAATALSVLDCDDIELLRNMSDNCQSAVLTNEPDVKLRNYVPTGVVCTDTPRRRPPLPPSPPPAPPPGVRPATDMSIPAVNYTMRIVHLRSGLTTYRNGSRVTQGRLEVLLPRVGPNGTREGEPVWGSVCQSAFVSDEVAKYACRSNGLPYKAATLVYGVRPKQPRLDSQPVHWVLLRGCTDRPDGLACGATMSRDDVAAFQSANRAAVRAGLPKQPLPYDDQTGWYTGLPYAMAACDTQRHQVDVFVRCTDSYPSYSRPPPLPSPPPSPPYPPAVIRNAVQFNVTTIADNLYYIMFGVPVPGGQPGELVWGHFCPRNTFPGGDDLYIDRTAANAVCNQITGGARPYGYYNFLQNDKPWPLLPPQDERLSRPVVLEAIDCSMVPPPAIAYDGGHVLTQTELQYPRVENISLCEVTLAAYPPEPLQDGDSCYFRAWGARRLISCIDSPWIETPYMTSVRLAGGDGTWGRLEIVMHRESSDYLGWGTVCAPEFTIKQAQGVCRDLGLGWTEARLLPTSAAAPLENADSVPIHMDGIACFANRVWWARPWSEEREQPPSFLRDCRPDWRGSIIKTCDHRTDVVIACGGSAEVIHAPVPGPPPAATQPTSAPPPYGAYGVQPPPPYGGPYGGYGSYAPPPPGYGGPYGGAYGGYGA